MRTSIWLLMLVAALVLCAVPERANAGEWRAGVARVKITPEQPLLLSGKQERNRPAAGTLHDLWAKALVLEDSAGARVVLVTMDLVGIDRALSQAVCADLRARYGLDRAQVALASSHTHNGPVVGSNLANMFLLDADQQALIDAYAARLRRELVALVGSALDRLTPCRVKWGVGKVDFAINRRDNPRAEVEARIESGDFRGPVDHDVPVLSVVDRNDRLKAVVFGYACHPIWLRHFNVWSGDYPGIAQSRLEESHPDTVALFWQGCGGDQNPVSRGGKLERAEAQSSLLDDKLRPSAIDEVASLGKRLAAAVEEVLAGKAAILDSKIAFDYREIDLPLGQAPDRLQWTIDAQSKDVSIARRAKQILRELDAGKPPRKSYPYPVQAWCLGQHLLIVALGGETVVDYSLRLKSHFEGRKTWVAGYTNDVMAYVPSRRVLVEGGYEGGDSMVYYGLPARWDERIEDLIVQNVIEQVDGLLKPAGR
jgi:neutral ceramidase